MTATITVDLEYEQYRMWCKAVGQHPISRLAYAIRNALR